MGKKVWVSLLVVVLALGVAGGAAGYLLLQRRQDDAARRAAVNFAHGWQTGGLSRLSYAVGDAASVAKQTQAATAGLTSASPDRPASVTVQSVERAGSSGTARLAVRWTLTGGRSWSYTSTLAVKKVQGTWRPVFAAAALHPRLTTGATLRTTTQDAARGRILGAGGQVLLTERPVVVVGIQPSRASDPAAAARSVAAVVGVDGAELAKRVAAAGKESFVQAIVLRETAYQKVRDRLQPIPGAVFQKRTLALAPSSTFARALLGSVGPATAEVVKESKGRVQAGQTAGLSGVQRSYDEQLAGTAGITVLLVPPGATGGSSSATTTSTATATAPETLFSVPPVAGKDLKLTLDRVAQVAAEKALGAAKKPAALVAIDTTTGGVLAVANGGPNAAGYNRAVLGRYPPGSTFKVVSGLALLKSGVTPSTPIKCPATVNAGGRVFSNAEGEVLGTVPFRKDFADSCNTAFVGSATKVSSAELSATAKSLGYGRKNELGVEAFTGSVPSSEEPVSHAAAMIGQGTVLASPVTVAGASAGVAAGTWQAPHLLAEAKVASTKLPTAEVRALRTLMRGVVTGGTATVMASTPGGPVYGKTGTAEFGNDSPPKTHAWFTGYQGEVAFAVVVEDGGFGAETAAPIAKAFLTSLARS